MNAIKVYEIKTTRDNIISVGRLAVKSIIDRSCFEGLHDRSPEVTNFCNILEHALSFSMKGSSNSLFAVDNKRHPWLFVREACRSMPDSCVATIDTMENLKGNFAKLRGWIKMAMLQKRLGEYLHFAIQQGSTVMKYYYPRSLVRSIDFMTLINTIVGLNAVDFSFDLRGEDQEHPGLVCIDYTPYLRFTSSDEALLDDALECDEHLNLNPSCPWQERFIKVDQKFKLEAEQKFFLEERLRKVDEQLIGREREREQFETEMKQLESVILELQVQITLLHEQYRSELTKMGGNPDVLPNLPAARGHTRRIPPSQLIHRLTPVEPTSRPPIGRQEFASQRRYSSPFNSSRENLMPATPTPTPDTSLRNSRTNLQEATISGHLWEDEELERVLLFPDDEEHGKEIDEEMESKPIPALDALKEEESAPVTPEMVRRVRNGEEATEASGYYCLLSVTVEENSIQDRPPASPLSPPPPPPPPPERERGDGRSADGEVREDIGTPSYSCAEERDDEEEEEEEKEEEGEEEEDEGDEEEEGEEEEEEEKKNECVEKKFMREKENEEKEEQKGQSEEQEMNDQVPAT